MWVVVAAAGGTESSRRSPTLARTSSESTSFRSASATAAGEVCGLNVRLHELARELCGHERNLREIEGDALRPVLLARRRHTHTETFGGGRFHTALQPHTTNHRLQGHAARTLIRPKLPPQEAPNTHRQLEYLPLLHSPPPIATVHPAERHLAHMPVRIARARHAGAARAWALNIAEEAASGDAVL